MPEDQQASNYMYVTQLLSMVFTFDHVKFGQVCFRMHIGLIA